MPILASSQYSNGYGKNSNALVSIESAAASTSAFVTQYTSGGKPKWGAKIAIPGGNLTGQGVATDSSGNVYVVVSQASITSGSNALRIVPYNYDGSPHPYPIEVAHGSASTRTSAVVVKYNRAGVVQWNTHITSSTTGPSGFSIAVDSAGNAYVVGQYTGTLTIYNPDLTTGPTTAPTIGTTSALIAKLDTNGYAQWAATAISTGVSGSAAYWIAIDTSDNIYVTGQTSATGTTATAYNSSGTAFGTTFASSAGDAFIVKYNTSGNVQWLARVSSTALDRGYGITTDSGGNVYVTGQGGSGVTVTAYSSNGAAFGTTLTSIGGGDAFLVKYNTSGTVQWVAKLGTTVADFGYGVAVDSADNVYVTGQSGSGGTLTAFSSNNVAFGTTLTSVGNTDVFLVKYNSSGTVQWVAKLGSTLADIGYALATDASDNVYLTGRYTGTMSAYSSNGSAFGTTISNSSIYNTYLAKYDSSGTVQWLTSFVAENSSEGRAIDVDSTGNVCIVGTFRSRSAVGLYNKPSTVLSTIPAPSGGLADAFAIKYSTNGIPQWYVRVTSASTETGRAIAYDKPNNAFYIGGTYGATATAYNSDGTAFGTTLALVGTSPAFLVKYNASGFVEWHTKLTHPNGAQIWALATDSVGNVFATGRYNASGSLTAYNSDGTTFATTLANAGNTDVFLVKYNSSGFVQWLARCISSSLIDEVWSVAVDGYDQPYIMGNEIGNTVVTINNADGTTFRTYTTTATANSEVYIVKYDNSTGQAVFSTRIASTTTAYKSGNRIAINPRSSLDFFYTIGGISTSVSDTVSFYHENGTLETRFNQTYALSGAFVAQYYTNGYVGWTAKITPTTFAANVQNAGCAVDNAGNVYIVTYYYVSSGGVTYPFFNSDGTRFGVGYPTAITPGSTRILAKYNSSGSVLWTSRITTSDAIGGGGTDIACDSGGNVYICGQSGTTSAGTTFVFNSDGSIAFATVGAVPLIKYDTDGYVKWVQRGNAIPQSIALDRNNDVYIAGSTTTALDILDTDGTSRFIPFSVPTSGAACLIKLSSGAAPQWLARIQSFPASAIAYSAAVDSSGNSYLAGSGAAAATIVAYNASGSEFGTVLANAGGTDAFVAKYDTSGTVQWLARIASAGNEVGYGIAVDSSANAYVIGSGVGTITAYSSDGNPFGTTLPNAGGGDAFLVKYDTNGTVQWVARIASTATDVGYGISTDSSGNVYVTGAGGAAVVTSYSSNGVAFSPTLASAGLGDVFIVKYNASGTVQWNARIATTATDIGYATATDSSGNVYITGQGGSGAVITAYNSSGTAFGTTLANAGLEDAFVVKYNTSGTVQWVARVATSGTDAGYSIATDSSANVYVTGTGGGTVTAYNSNGTAFATTLTDSGGGLAFLVKYNTSGSVQWVAKIDGTGADIGYAVTTDSAGNVYVAGQTAAGGVIAAYHSTNVLYGSATLKGTGYGTQNQGFMVKYNSSGTVQWIIEVGGGGADSIRGVKTDSSTNLYVTGGFSGCPLILNSV